MRFIMINYTKFFYLSYLFTNKLLVHLWPLICLIIHCFLVLLQVFLSSKILKYGPFFYVVFGVIHKLLISNGGRSGGWYLRLKYKGRCNNIEEGLKILKTIWYRIGFGLLFWAESKISNSCSCWWVLVALGNKDAL